jgi:Uma2 family endonuclease
METTVDRLLRRHRLTVSEYHKMGEAGILGPHTRVELIDGEIIDMAPIESRHAGTVNMLVERLGKATGDRAILAVQNPLVLNDYWEPQPDVMLLRLRPDHYRNSHPGAADVLLLIEVAESSAGYDRNAKLPGYARHGIPEAALTQALTPYRPVRW